MKDIIERCLKLKEYIELRKTIPDKEGHVYFNSPIPSPGADYTSLVINLSINSCFLESWCESYHNGSPYGQKKEELGDKVIDYLTRLEKNLMSDAIEKAKERRRTEIEIEERKKETEIAKSIVETYLSSAKDII